MRNIQFVLELTDTSYWLVLKTDWNLDVFRLQTVWPLTQRHTTAGWLYIFLLHCWGWRTPSAVLSLSLTLVSWFLVLELCANEHNISRSALNTADPRTPSPTHYTLHPCINTTDSTSLLREFPSCSISLVEYFIRHSMWIINLASFSEQHVVVAQITLLTWLECWYLISYAS